jgi:hypothetical protein
MPAIAIQVSRDFSDARVKVEREGRCRLHESGFCIGPLSPAHILGFGVPNRDRLIELATGPEEDRRDASFWVSPNRIVPLCRLHHMVHQLHKLDLLDCLTAEEEAQAVLDAGSLEAARRRLRPS